jgi:NADPH:quinone reductase-like Zn-dependent oxidoreductase
MSGGKCEISLGQIITKRLQIKGNAMRSRSLSDKRAITQRFREQWLPLLQAGKIKPIIDSVFPWEKVQEAHRYMESNRNFGKIILTIS